MPLIDARYAVEEAFDGTKQRVKECAFPAKTFVMKIPRGFVTAKINPRKKVI